MIIYAAAESYAGHGLGEDRQALKRKQRTLNGAGSSLAGSSVPVPAELRQHLVRIARDALERRGQHLRHAGVSFGGFEEAVGVTHQPVETVLPEFGLHASTERPVPSA